MAVLGKHENLQNGFINLAITTKDDYAKLSLETPNGRDRVPCDIVAVLDISGSMDSEASVKNTQGIKESQGLTYLDILKHAVKTIIHNLNEFDRFALVSYSDYARIDYPLNIMNKPNRENALQVLENLHTEGCTNIWDGLKAALDLMKNHYQEG